MSAQTKLELLGLIDGAVADGWAHARACRVLDLTDSRAHHWRQRLRKGPARSRTSSGGGGAVHGLLAWEEQAILDLIEQWDWVDRSHRELAHRGSYTGVVYVSPSTVLRVALKNGAVLPGEPVRPQADLARISTGRVGAEQDLHVGRDPLHGRAKRIAYAIVEVVTRYWIGYLLTSQQTHTGTAAVRPGAPGPGGCWRPDGLPPNPAGEEPILVAWSDNGTEMGGPAAHGAGGDRRAPWPTGHPDRPRARRELLQPS